MRCPRCEAENREGRRFCAECGASLALACLIARTEGDPFFLEESVRTLVETGSLVVERAACRQAAAKAFERSANREMNMPFRLNQSGAALVAAE